MRLPEAVLIGEAVSWPSSLRPGRILRAIEEITEPPEVSSILVTRLRLRCGPLAGPSGIQKL